MGVDVKGTPQPADHILDDIGGMVGTERGHEFADWGCAADIVVNLPPHGLMASITRLRLPDCQRRNLIRQHAMPLIKAHVFFGMRYADGMHAEYLIKLVADGVIVERLWRLSSPSMPSYAVFCRRRSAIRAADIAASVFRFQHPGEVIDAGDMQIEFSVEIVVPVAFFIDDARQLRIADFDMRHMQRVA